MIRHSFLILSLSMAGALGAYAAEPRVLPPKQTVYTLRDALPDASGIRRMAVLRGLDKTTGRAIDLSAPVGVPIRFGTLSLVVRYCHTVPPEEPPETTAFLQIDDLGEGREPPKRMFSGWMFASTPALNALQHAVYDVWVITCKTDDPAAQPPPVPVTPPAAPAAAPARPAPAAAPVGTAPAAPARGVPATPAPATP